MRVTNSFHSAVRFVREQALAVEAAAAESPQINSRTLATPSRSSKAVKRLFTRNQETKREPERATGPLEIDPNLVEFPGSEKHQKHFYVLFQPQIVLRSDVDDESVVILSANDAALTSMNEMEKGVEDPVTGHLRTR